MLTLIKSFFCVLNPNFISSNPAVIKKSTIINIKHKIIN